MSNQRDQSRAGDAAEKRRRVHPSVDDAIDDGEMYTSSEYQRNGKGKATETQESIYAAEDEEFQTALQQSKRLRVFGEYHHTDEGNAFIEQAPTPRSPISPIEYVIPAEDETDMALQALQDEVMNTLIYVHLPVTVDLTVPIRAIDYSASAVQVQKPHSNTLASLSPKEYLYAFTPPHSNQQHLWTVEQQLCLEQLQLIEADVIADKDAIVFIQGSILSNMRRWTEENDSGVQLFLCNVLIPNAQHAQPLQVLNCAKLIEATSDHETLANLSNLSARNLINMQLQPWNAVSEYSCNSPNPIQFHNFNNPSLSDWHDYLYALCNTPSEEEGEEHHAWRYSLQALQQDYVQGLNGHHKSFNGSCNAEAYWLQHCKFMLPQPKDILNSNKELGNIELSKLMYTLLLRSALNVPSLDKTGYPLICTSPPLNSSVHAYTPFIQIDKEDKNFHMKTLLNPLQSVTGVYIPPGAAPEFVALCAVLQALTVNENKHHMLLANYLRLVSEEVLLKQHSKTSGLEQYLWGALLQIRRLESTTSRLAAPQVINGEYVLHIHFINVLMAYLQEKYGLTLEATNLLCSGQRYTGPPPCVLSMELVTSLFYTLYFHNLPDSVQLKAFNYSHLRVAVSDDVKAIPMQPKLYSLLSLAYEESLEGLTLGVQDYSPIPSEYLVTDFFKSYEVMQLTPSLADLLGFNLCIMKLYVAEPKPFMAANYIYKLAPIAAATQSLEFGQDPTTGLDRSIFVPTDTLINKFPVLRALFSTHNLYDFMGKTITVQGKVYRLGQLLGEETSNASFGANVYVLLCVYSKFIVYMQLHMSLSKLRITLDMKDYHAFKLMKLQPYSLATNNNQQDDSFPYTPASITQQDTDDVEGQLAMPLPSHNNSGIHSLVLASIPIDFMTMEERQLAILRIKYPDLFADVNDVDAVDFEQTTYL